jgi:hypothetical protein
MSQPTWKTDRMFEMVNWKGWERNHDVYQSITPSKKHENVVSHGQD